MQSHLTPKFHDLFRRLPADVRRDAKKSYLLWKRDPFHPGLHLKQINEKKRLWSVRASLGWRALGVRREADEIVWVWIGPHADYDEATRPRSVRARQTP